MENALSYYGCESANTAGNENGTGLKTFASYFTSGNPESFFIIVSKSKYGELKTKEIDYVAFRGSRNLKDRNSHTTEYLFTLKKK